MLYYVVFFMERVYDLNRNTFCFHTGERLFMNVMKDKISFQGGKI